jgi:hypothetical protein
MTPLPNILSKLKPGRTMAAGLLLLGLGLAAAPARAQNGTDPESIRNNLNSCVGTLGPAVCYNWPNSSPRKPDYWAAIAISPSTLTAGSSHGQTSKIDAERLAMRNCGSAARDCKPAAWAVDDCVALAISLSDDAYGANYGDSREGAANVRWHIAGAWAVQPVMSPPRLAPPTARNGRRRCLCRLRGMRPSSTSGSSDPGSS